MFLTICSTLFALASVAQAGTWSNPVYNVSNRAPVQAGTEHANGGGGGSVGMPATSPAVVDESGPGASGTITATFTWTPDYVGEAAPEKVFVLQTGSAKWSEGTVGGGHPGGGLRAPASRVYPTPTSSPYAQGWHCDLTLTSESTQAAGGADDGLGDPEVALEAPTVGGVSSGTHVVVVTVGGGGGAPVTITTPAVSLSASCAGDNPMTSWNYSAQVAEPVMTCNGTTMSPDKQLQVMVGQHIAVAVSVPVPNIMPVTQQWTVPGDRIKNFVETAEDLTTTPPTPAKGEKVELAAADLQQSAVSFYWYNGSFGGTSNDVTDQVTVDGKSITLTGKVKVFRPRLVKLESTYTMQNPMVDYHNGYIQFGQRTSEALAGIKWTGTVKTPNVAIATGVVCFEQMVNLNREYEGTAGGTPYKKRKKQNKCLDSADLDPRYGIPEDTAFNSTVDVSETDSPGVSPEFSDSKVSIHDSFRTFLMYCPPGNDSIWITLGIIEWQWDVNATYPWAYGITNPFPQTPSQCTA